MTMLTSLIAFITYIDLQCFYRFFIYWGEFFFHIYNLWIFIRKIESQLFFIKFDLSLASSINQLMYSLGPFLKTMSNFKLSCTSLIPIKPVFFVEGLSTSPELLSTKIILFLIPNSLPNNCINSRKDLSLPPLE